MPPPVLTQNSTSEGTKSIRCNSNEPINNIFTFHFSNEIATNNNQSVAMPNVKISGEGVGHENMIHRDPLVLRCLLNNASFDDMNINKTKTIT